MQKLDDWVVRAGVLLRGDPEEENLGKEKVRCEWVNDLFET